MTILEMKARKIEGQKISMVTCYDAWTARLLARSPIDLLLVGDSSAMVMHGHPDTLSASVDMICTHVAAVRRGAPTKFIVADMPFLSFRKDLNSNMDAVQKLMQAGAQAIKLEGAVGNGEFVRHVVDSGVPVMGHLGLTPQFINQFGGFRVQGRGDEAARAILDQAFTLEAAGAFAIVLECVPAELAKTITEKISIPTIGIGAGPGCDGQVLVLQDLLGMNSEFKPKFLRTYLNGEELFLKAFKEFDADVKEGRFPNEKESYA